jgi:hypothetical protein
MDGRRYRGARGFAGLGLLVAACGGADQSDLLAPDAVTPKAQMAVAAVTLSSLTITPDKVTLAPGGRYQFGVKASWSDGSTTTPTVIWATNGGAVSTTGLYLAPSTTGNYRVLAYHSGSGKSDTAYVTVGSTTSSVVSLTVSPDPASVQPGKTVQLKAIAKFSNGTTGTTAVAWTASGGTVSSTGLYTAGSSTGTYSATATAKGTTVKDAAAVKVAWPTVTKLVISPSSTLLLTGATKQFTATATWSDGVSRSVSLAWSATGGTVSTSGYYKAGTTTGTYRVIVGCASGCSKKDTASVSISSATTSTSTTSFSISPKTITLDIGEVYQFTSTTTVTWSASGGSFSSSGGWYRAPRTAGTYTVTARTSSGAANTATVTVKTPTGPYFTDNFDSCSLNKTANALGFRWNDTGGGTSSEVPRISTATKHSGSCSLRFTYAGGLSGDDAWSEQRFRLGKRLSEIYIRWYQYFPSGSTSSIGAKYVHRNDTGPDNNKFLRLWDEDYRNYKMKTGFSTLPKSGGDSFLITEYGNTTTSVGSHGSDGDPDGITNSRRGRWVKFVAHVRLATSANNDGVIELWVDGVKTISNTNLPLYPTGGVGNYMRNGYLMGWANSGFSTTSHTYIDDVTISGVPIS